MKKALLVVATMMLIIMTMTGCSCNMDSIYGVWWWDNTLDTIYIDYAKECGINEIYLCDTRFSSDTAEYVSYAKSKDIKVYTLMGEYQWLYDSTNLISHIEDYIYYNATNTSAKLCGIHLDIEPHQSPEWKSSSSLSEAEKNAVRTNLVTKLITLAHDLKVAYPNIHFSYDIPFWLDHMVTLGGVEKEAYKHMIDIADKVFLMSYRDTAENIVSVSQEEIDYATSVSKTVVLGVETYSEEGDQVSFMEEGKEYMFGEIARLRGMVPSGTGVSIHHIKTLYDLKD